MTANRFLRLSILLVFGAPSFCWAQLPAPRLTTLFPPGVQRGQTVEVTLGGSDLDGLTGLHFSGPGLTVSEVAGNKLKITAAADAPVGVVDVRAVGAWGVSNVRRFAISDLPEVVETEPNNLKELAKPVGLNVVVNGRADARSDVDYFTFPVEKGQTVVLDCAAERIDSRMTAVLTLFSPSLKQEAIEIGYTGKDPRTVFTASESGQYMVRVHDLTYDGSAEYFYRLSISTQPTIVSVFPPVASLQRPDNQAVLTGHNLGAESIAQPLAIPQPYASSPGLDPVVLLFPYQAWMDAFTVRPQIAGKPAPPVLIGLSELPVVTEQEPNNEAAQANAFPFPGEAVGRIDGENDRDCYRFTAKKDQVIRLNVFAERLGSPIDMVAVLRRIVSANEGKLQLQDVAEYDDFGTNVGRTKFDTSTHDPAADIKIPADGDYVLEVADQFSGVRGGPRSVYRLQLAPHRPDFRLAVAPAEEDAFSSVVVRQGGNVHVHVFALRQDGFAGEIRVEAVNLPPGVSAPPVVLGPGVNEAPLVFTAAADAPESTAAVEIRGTATIDSKTVTRTARSGEIVWSGAANAAKPTRLTQEFVLACRPKAPYRLQATPAEATVSQGSQLTLNLQLDRHWEDFTQPLADVTAVHLPANVENQKVTIGEKQSSAALHLYFTNNAPVGTYSFLTSGSAKVKFTKTPNDPNAKKVDVTVADPSLPITVKIVPRALELAANPAAATVKRGEKTTVKVTVKRVNNYQGPVRLQLTTPPGVEGLTAPEATLAADQTEANIEIACAQEVPPGDKAFVTIRGWAGDLAADAKLTVKVTE